MKIAVTYEAGMVFQHFGHTETFKVYEEDNGEIVRTQVVGTEGSGHGALAEMLKELGVEVLICGGIGGGARMALLTAGIEIFGGVSGNADEAVEAYLSGTLSFDPLAKCNHHEEGHGEGHDCGSHGCGSHCHH